MDIHNTLMIQNTGWIWIYSSSEICNFGKTPPEPSAESGGCCDVLREVKPIM